MKIHLLFILLIANITGWSQSPQIRANFKKEYQNIVNSDDTVNLRVYRPNKIILFVENTVLGVKNIFHRKKKVKKPVLYVNTAGNPMMAYLLQMEDSTKYEKYINANTRSLITEIPDSGLFALVLLERAIKENTNINLQVKDKLLEEVSAQINLVVKNQFPFYTYETKNKQLIKFISIRSGNDLFTLTGLYDLTQPSNKYVKDNHLIFQRNDDRDYTGSLLIEIGTDYMNSLRRRPLKTYQTILYGFDVYTPYFKDKKVFPADTSHNPKDRPHASFQYYGWSKKVLDRNNSSRTTWTIKVGKIGGSAGAKFQNTLHQDVSYSPRPRGWGAQIANNGRFGISIEGKQEFCQKSFFHKYAKGKPNGFWNMYSSFITEEKVGTYMSNLSGGLQISNKSFQQNNSNFINHRIRQTVDSRLHHFMYRVSFMTTYVKHNTMLEGYGIFKCREKDNDPLTPPSRYYLGTGQIQRFTYVFNYTLSYTSRYATFFYNWKSLSPETTLGKIGVNSPSSGKEMDISNRWQHFAEIGITFNIK
jgi:hypothetical protein